MFEGLSIPPEELHLVQVDDQAVIGPVTFQIRPLFGLNAVRHC